MKEKSARIVSGSPLGLGASEAGDLFVGRALELKKLREWYSQSTQTVAAILGERGAGKTALIYKFSASSKDLFPGGIHHIHGYAFESLAQIVQRELPTQCVRPTLLVLDDAENFSPDLRDDIRAILPTQPKLSLLLAARPTFEFPDFAGPYIRLGGLNELEFREILAQRLSFSDDAAAAELWKLFDGNPSLAQLAGKTVREGLESLSDLFQKLTNFVKPGILGPDGKPVSTESLQAKKIIIEIEEVNDQLLQRIREDPNSIYDLSSRKFEEIVAEILTRKGFRVELTPPSKDGGFDMYAARKDGMGDFLYLVECKKYAPENKVGVQIVRSLHGVVQQKRATAGIVATTSCFTKGAQEFRNDVTHQMTLADYVELQGWLSGVMASQKTE